MTAAKGKAAGPWRGEAASNTHYDARHGIGSIPARQPHRLRLPAYGRALVAAQRQGMNVPWLLVALSWDMGIAVPRVVVPADIHAAELDLTCVAGVACVVGHRGEPSRAIDIAEAALRAGAKACPIFDVAVGKLTATTADVMAIRGRGRAAA